MAERYDQNAILAYVEDEMSPDQRRAFEQQLERDDALRRLVGDMIGDRDALRKMTRENAPPGMVDAAIGHLERRMLLDDPHAAEQPQLTGPIPIRAAHPRRKRPIRWLGYAAVAAILVVSGAVMFQTLILPEQPLPKVAESRARNPLIAPPAPEPTADALAEAESLDAEETAVEDPAAGVPALVRRETGDLEEALAAAEPAELTEPQTSLAAAAPPLPEAPAPPASSPARLGDLPSAAPSVVRVETASPHETEDRLLRWAVSNDASVVTPLPVRADPFADEGNRLLGRARQATAESAELGMPPRQHVIVQMDASQVDSLVHYLNTYTDQRAAVVGGPSAAKEVGQVAATENERSLGVDWGAVLQTQVPLAPVQQMGPITLPQSSPQLVNVKVEFVERQTQDDVDDAGANRTLDVDDDSADTPAQDREADQ